MTTPQTDRAGISHSWQVEYQDWLQARRERGLADPGFQSNAPKARLSDILALLAEVRATPSLWEAISKQASAEYIDPGKSPPDDPNVASRYAIASLISEFVNWFRMRRGLADTTLSYMTVPAIAESIARGDLVGDDIIAIRARLIPNSFEDDLTDRKTECVAESSQHG